MWDAILPAVAEKHAYRWHIGLIQDEAAIL